MAVDPMISIEASKILNRIVSNEVMIGSKPVELSNMDEVVVAAYSLGRIDKVKELLGCQQD
jgi:hypothetical protein